MRADTWTLVAALVAATGWGQYWYDRAHRLADAIQFMMEEEISNG